MTLSLPDGWTGRLLALAILAGLLGSGYLLVAAPLRDLYGARQALLQDRRAMAARMEAASRQVPALRARLAQIQAVANSKGFAIDGSDDAIASANLQGQVEKLAGTLGVALASTEALPAEDRGGLRVIRLHIAVSSDYENLLQLFGKLEDSQPPLTIENLQIRTILRPAGMPGTAKLDAGFDISAFRRGDAPAQAGKAAD